MENSFSIKVDGTGEEFSVANNTADTLLGAALRQGLGFPYECNSGGCGSCMFEVVSGEVKELWPEAPGLSAKARERGRRLACQCEPASDCVIKVRLKNNYVPLHRPTRVAATLVEVRKLTHDLTEFCFKTPEPAAFLPGQFALLHLPGVEGARAYSMSNLPTDGGTWNFIIRHVPKGRGTAVLFTQLKTGDQIDIDGPYGLAYLRPESPRDIVCIGGGSGLSPMVSIVRAAVRDPRLAGRKITFFYGARTPDDLCIKELLARDPLMAERATIVPAISTPTEGWQGEQGFIHEVMQQKLATGFENYEFYCCGPPPMTEALQKLLLLDKRVPAQQLHFDRFY
ncbi:MAG: 2Fe-2S iron-sulfur cluster-binding protein [Rugosibacter sp.]|jgi:toluene monooxygenase electron transfer component|nr:2Fe-2S iron-sulfur cluster-binding protein [Rugosibacter sp.]MDO9272088.1 2Fe-2S iron-sulfur cluster-binding protein [Rugosibacter sp.]